MERKQAKKNPVETNWNGRCEVIISKVHIYVCIRKHMDTRCIYAYNT